MTDFARSASSQGVGSVAAAGTFRGTWQRSAATQGVALTATAGVGVKPRSASVQAVCLAVATGVFRGTWRRSAVTQGVALTATAGVGVKPRSASVQGVCLVTALGYSSAYPLGGASAALATDVSRLGKYVGSPSATGGPPWALVTPGQNWHKAYVLQNGLVSVYHDKALPYQDTYVTLYTGAADGSGLVSRDTGDDEYGEGRPLATYTVTDAPRWVYFFSVMYGGSTTITESVGWYIPRGPLKFERGATVTGVSAPQAAGTFRGKWFRAASAQGVHSTAAVPQVTRYRSASATGVSRSFPVGVRRVVITGLRSSSYEVVGPIVSARNSAYDISDTIVIISRVVTAAFDIAARATKISISSYDIERKAVVPGPEEIEMATLVQLNGFNLNDGVQTFLRTGIKLPRCETTFDEVRSGMTGNIRQVDVRSPLTSAVLPLMFKASSAKKLKDLTNALTVEVLKGGILYYQEGGDSADLPTAQTYTIGVSPAPEIIQDRLYRHEDIAIFELTLVALAP